MKGVVQKIMTLTDGSVRFMVDVPLELAPDDIKAWMFEYVDLVRSAEVKKTLKGESHGKTKKRR